MTNVELKAQIDLQITDETVDYSITPAEVGGNMKDIVDYVDQEVSNVSSATKVLKTTITAAQILDIFTTPIEIIPAPGVGKTIIPSFITIINRFNTTTYSDAGGAWKVTFFGSSLATIVSYLGSATYDKQTIQTLFYSALTTIGTFENQPLMLTTSSNNPIGGDSGIDVYVTYIEITL